MVNNIVNAGKGTQPKLERNENIVTDYTAKMPIPVMVGKYGVSATVIYNVLERYGIKTNRKVIKPRKHKRITKIK
jgi:hypothetical protein